ncbi:polysaccharide deacetylase family protein [Candidatus Nitrospira salsa]|nr:MAG: polysaccharide deacetylase [Nitrospirales bacterium]
MRVRGLGRVKRYVRRMTAPFRSQAVILMYHRIFEASLDPWELCVSPQNFSEHLEHLRRHYRVLTLPHLVRLLKTSELPKRAVVLTFDDGYADNLWNAKPLLEHFDIPATVFVTTGYVGLNREFWWDELERIVLLTPQLPKSLELTLQGSRYTWELAEWADRPVITGNMGVSEWGTLSNGKLTSRHKAYTDLHCLLRPLAHEERRTALARLRSDMGVSGNGRSTYRPLTLEEIPKLANGSLVEIGSHTVTHPVLSAQSMTIQRQEMVESKRSLEKVLGRPVTTFCYPYGDVNKTAVELPNEVGFDAACTTGGRTVTSGVNPCLLPRTFVGNWNGEEFAKRLSKIFTQ